MTTVGCFLVGYTRKVTIPDCIEFPLTTNACRGYCESFAVSSNFAIGMHRPDQPVIIHYYRTFQSQLKIYFVLFILFKLQITSVGQCCNIMDSEEVKVKVRCLEGVREVTFRSATSCSCFHCKKS